MGETLAIASRGRRLVHWAVGTPVEVWRYAARSVPLYRSSVLVDADVPLLDVSNLAPGLARGVRRAADGTGPEFHRVYSVRIVGSSQSAATVLGRLSRDFGEASPSGMTEVDEPEGRLRVGDEVHIHLAGPWDAPVRVVDVDDGRFRFATLDGHMEAGEIEFRARDEADGAIVVTIESWARSATRPFAALYHPFGIAKEVQLHMWACVLERVAEQSGGSIDDGIRIMTRRHRVTRD